ncbi:uncharacterized protein LOC130720630 [Lotus japonicus]|uniref:uncharacterized protein LOC130720630 n=1 Tax=Lotus japonicus TaxID=34305 RepID=UPI00258A6985|nr:uncharacterized protein LOC130720630 [Lotus japonicus]
MVVQPWERKGVATGSSSSNDPNPNAAAEELRPACWKRNRSSPKPQCLLPHAGFSQSNSTTYLHCNISPPEKDTFQFCSKQLQQIFWIQDSAPNNKDPMISNLMWMPFRVSNKQLSAKCRQNGV